MKMRSIVFLVESHSILSIEENTTVENAVRYFVLSIFFFFLHYIFKFQFAHFLGAQITFYANLSMKIRK